MSILLLFFSSLALIPVIYFGRRYLALALLGCMIGLLLLAGDGPLPALALAGLQTHPRLAHPSWAENNAIILLGFGTAGWADPSQITSNALAYSRIHEAARLYYDCKQSAVSCRILASGGDPSRTGVSEADTMARELIEIGVAPSDLIREVKSRNTFQNAQFSSELVRKGDFGLVILVTSGIHLDRALRYFAHFGVAATPAPSDNLRAVFSALPLAYNFSFLDMALHEYAGIFLYPVYNFLGWNPPIIHSATR